MAQHSTPTCSFKFKPYLTREEELLPLSKHSFFVCLECYILICSRKETRKKKK